MSVTLTEVPVNDGPKNMDELKEYFDDAIKGIEMVLEAGSKQALRIDNVMECYLQYSDYRKKIYKEKDVSVIVGIELAEHMQGVYNSMLAIVDELTFDSFKDPEMKDPFSDLITYFTDPSDANAMTCVDLFYDYVTYRCVVPFGEKIENLHRLVQESLEHIED